MVHALRRPGFADDLPAKLGRGCPPHSKPADAAPSRVGHTEAQAREAGIKVKTETLSIKDVPRALATRNTRGLIKLVPDAETDRLVGSHASLA